MPPMRTAPALLALFLFGCAGLQRDSFVRERAAEFVYTRPLREVWTHVAALLSTQGYALHATEDPLVLETDWREELTGSTAATVWTRYQVIGKESNRRCAIRILRSTRSGDSTNDRRSDARMPAADTSDSISAQRAAAMRSAPSEEPSDGKPETVRDSGKAAKVSGTRDLSLEWVLLQRVDPDAAARIYSDAEARFR